MKCALLTLVVVLLAARSARADVGPIVPGWQYAQAVHRIECAESYPDYVFVIVRHRLFAEPKGELAIEFVQLSPGQPLEYTSGHRNWAELLIVPQSIASRYSTAAELADAVRSGSVSAVRQQFASRETAPSWSRTVTIRHRVQRAKSGDGIEIVRTSWNPLWQWYTVVILFLLAILFGGFRLARRIVRRGRTKPAT